MPADAPSGIATALGLDEADEYADYDDEVGVEQLNGHSEAPVTLLPQRNPGASGISDSATTVDEDLALEPDLQPDSEPEPWGEEPVAEEQRQAPVDTSAFFASRDQASSSNGAHTDQAEPEAEESPGVLEEEISPTAGADDAIYQKMLSEWLVDPSELANSTDLNWESVWDHGWSAAEAAEEAPVASHTEHGLPVRDPGARLVPGTAGAARWRQRRSCQRGSAPKPDDDDEVESAADLRYRRARDSGT